MIRYHQTDIVYKRINLIYNSENDFENEKFTTFDGKKKRQLVFH